MRPVNLIPPEERRGQHAPLRTGPLVYVLIGTLVAVLAGVVALVLADNQISEREDEIVTLEREDAPAAARAARLASYTQFRLLGEQRVQTVQSLADSRFDWERVLRELALVLPSDVALSNLNATASSAGVGGEGESAGGGGLRGAVAGPALEMNGCAHGQTGVAGFVTALEDIDGVTRVGVQSSNVAEEGGEASGATEGAGDCGSGAATFSLLVAFDAAPVPVSEGSGEVEATETASQISESTEG